MLMGLKESDRIELLKNLGTKAKKLEGRILDEMTSIEKLAPTTHIKGGGTPEVRVAIDHFTAFPLNVGSFVNHSFSGSALRLMRSVETIKSALLGIHDKLDYEDTSIESTLKKIKGIEELLNEYSAIRKLIRANTRKIRVRKPTGIGNGKVRKRTGRRG